MADKYIHVDFDENGNAKLNIRGVSSKEVEIVCDHLLDVVEEKRGMVKSPIILAK